MSLLNSIKRLFGIDKESSLTEAESRLLVQLQTNRKTATEKVIPDDMRDDFVKYVYPDKHLQSLVKDIYHEPLFSDNLFNDNENLRIKYLERAIQYSLSVESFGLNLILHHRILPESVEEIMLFNIEKLLKK